MATFISTTLAKRSGGTTVFAPRSIDNGVGTLLDTSGLFQASKAKMTMSSKRTRDNRRTARVQIRIPQVETIDGVPRFVREGLIELSINVPDGYRQADVDDLVGYIRAVTDPALVNLNALLVNGEGVY